MAGDFTFPSSPRFESVREKKRHYQVTSESINGKVQVRSIGASRREYRIKWPVMTRAQFATVYAFLDNLEGMLYTFDITIPNPENPSVEHTVTCRMDGPLQEYDIGVDNLVEFEIDAIEVL